MLRIYPSIIKTNIVSHYKTTLTDKLNKEYDIAGKCYNLNITADHIKINGSTIPSTVSDNLINFLNNSPDKQYNSFYFTKYLVNSNAYTHISKTDRKNLDILKPFDRITIYSYYREYKHSNELEIGEPELASIYIGKFFDEHLFLSHIKLGNQYNTGLFVNNIDQLLDTFGCSGNYITFFRALDTKLFSYKDREFDNNIRAFPRKIDLD